VNWGRAVHHVESLAQACQKMTATPASIVPLRVRQLWLVDDLFGAPGEVETVAVALAVDLPEERVAWLSEPTGAGQWGHATRLGQSPLRAYWRSVHAPVWNHRIVRPALVWDDTDGVRAEVLAAVREGHGEQVRTPAPSADELRERLAREQAVSLAHLRDRTDHYADRRFQPGKLEPVADALWRATEGYLDLLDAA